MDDKGENMSKEKKVIILIVVIIVILMLPIVYMQIATTSTEKNTKLNVTASNGVEFREVYTLYNFPDESYDIKLYGRNKEFIHLFGGDGSGNKHIVIEYLCSSGNLDYYKVIHEYREKVYEKLFVYNEKERIAFDDCEKYIESFPDGIIMFNDTESDIFELFIPAAKYQILSDNNGDYIEAYAERLIMDGNNDILQKLHSFVENPNDIKCELKTKDEILAKCNELLQKYGGGQ